MQKQSILSVKVSCVTCFYLIDVLVTNWLNWEYLKFRLEVDIRSSYISMSATQEGCLGDSVFSLMNFDRFENKFCYRGETG